MKCGACTVDRDGYCACADFFGGRLAFWRGEYDGDQTTDTTDDGGEE